MHMNLRALAASVALAAPALGCRSAPPATPPDVSQHEWTLSRARLAKAREAQPKRPYVERLRVAIIDPRTGKRYESRGAVAVSPDRAARLLLLAPGGATALDLWVTPDRFRFVAPALKYERRGGADPEDARGLPVGMLRWWFLAPLSGRLLVARSTDRESAWLLRDGSATIMVRTDGRRFLAHRRQAEHAEGIDWIGPGASARAGSRGVYVDGAHGLRVEVLVEDVLTTEPDPAAFQDPDLVSDDMPTEGGTSL